MDQPRGGSVTTNGLNFLPKFHSGTDSFRAAENLFSSLKIELGRAAVDPSVIHIFWSKRTKQKTDPRPFLW